MRGFGSSRPLFSAQIRPRYGLLNGCLLLHRDFSWENESEKPHFLSHGGLIITLRIPFESPLDQSKKTSTDTADGQYIIRQSGFF